MIRDWWSCQLKRCQNHQAPAPIDAQNQEGHPFSLIPNNIWQRRPASTLCTYLVIFLLVFPNKIICYQFCAQNIYTIFLHLHHHRRHHSSMFIFNQNQSLFFQNGASAAPTPLCCRSIPSRYSLYQPSLPIYSLTTKVIDWCSFVPGIPKIDNNECISMKFQNHLHRYK